MKYTNEVWRRVLLVLCLWLLILMIAYLLLHNFYAFTALPTPPLLYFLPAFIYILAGSLTGLWSLLHIRTPSISLLAVLALGIVLLGLGVIFSVQGLQHLHK